MGKTCVCGAEELDVDSSSAGRSAPDGMVVEEGDVISIDGTTGKVYRRRGPRRPSTVVRYFEGELQRRHADPLVAAVHRLMAHADAPRRLRRARQRRHPARTRRGPAGSAPQGIGLCRTEHMFLGDRRELVERLILADTDEEREAALDALLPLQRDDFVGILEAMDGLPVTIRLSTRRCTSSCPTLDELAVRVAVAEARGEDPDERRCAAAGRTSHARAEPDAGPARRTARPGRPRACSPCRCGRSPRLRRPSSGGRPAARDHGAPRRRRQELAIVRPRSSASSTRSPASPAARVDTPIGTMIEVPRAALTAGEIAREAEFFSFGTNDLTQMGWGFSRDDVEAAFFSRYLDWDLRVSPFESIDADGIGRLIRIACRRAAPPGPDLKIGVCGEHGGDPDSVRFFDEVGLDYVSCSPFRVPVARLEAGRAVALRG